MTSLNPDARAQRMVEQIHSTPTQAVIVVSGAGTQALAWIMSVPGASKTVLEGLIPYSRLSMVGFLGYDPAQYVSSETAKEMAGRAYARALELREGREEVVGLACTATIATDRPKRGDHRACVSLQNGTTAITYNLKLAKGKRTRGEEEELVSWMVLNVLAEACGLEEEVPLDLLPEDGLEVDSSQPDDPIKVLLSDLAAGTDLWVMVAGDGRAEVGTSPPSVVLAGSFDPLHVGHEGLAKAASAVLGLPVVLEMSVTNVDKPPLEEAEVRFRIEQFRGQWAVALTRAPTFREKAALFPGCIFVTGWDTAVRLIHPRYYDSSEQAMNLALEELRSAGCSFLVAGREQDGRFRTLADVDVPERFADLFDELPEGSFRQDISSTELRAR